MPYTIKEKKQYATNPDTLFQAARGAIDGLEGTVEEEDQAAHSLQAKFNKRIHGKTLGDRTRIHARVEGEDGNSEIVIEAYPIDPVGRKLMFGARKGVTRKVIEWFFAHLEHRLK